jgi:CRISPR-associated protein Csh1
MITEIVNFMECINEHYMTEKLKPSDGLHILVKLDDQGNIVKCEHWLINEKTTEEDVPKYYEFGLRDYYSNWISNNKAMDIGDVPGKMQILSVNPYSLFFTKLNFKNGNVLKKVPVYYKNILSLEASNEALKFSEHEINRINQIKKFIEKNLDSLLSGSPEFNNFNEKDKIKIYFDEDLESVRKAYDLYLDNKLFLVDDPKINLRVTKDNKAITYGLTSFFNTFGESNKPFLTHQTTNFRVNSRFESSVHRQLYEFKRMLENKKLPNPLPIFIDKNELNDDVVNLYNRKNVKKYREIVRNLIEKHKKDLSNYYLINWIKLKSIEVRDYDFVPLFKYHLDDFKIITYFSKEVKEQKPEIRNVFDFETTVVQKIFNNVLVQKSKDKNKDNNEDNEKGNEKYSFKYFDEIDFNSKYMTKTTYLNVLRYRKAFYDFIYKSKHNAITERMFRDIMISVIIDDIRHDEYKNNMHSHETRIREKLNIFFSLNKNFGGEDMGSKILPLQEKLKSLLSYPDTHIESDEEFAFAAGQLVYYLIFQSEVANKTHSLMEPFISKNDPEQFKIAIANGIDRYKHKLPYGTKKFQKIASEVLAWQTKTKIKDLLPIFLAGYFSNSQLLESSKEINNNKGV